jgi:hypothetical protein
VQSVLRECELLALEKVKCFFESVWLTYLYTMGEAKAVFHPIISSLQKIALYETKAVSV